MKVYITKYATTRGVVEYEAEVLQEDSTMIRTTNTPYPEHYAKHDWYVSLNEAKEVSCGKILHELFRLEKEVTKLQNLLNELK